MTVKHAELPWVYPEDSSKAPDLAIFSTVKPKSATSEYGACIAHLMLSDPVTGFLPKGQHVANARLIVTAVNAHYGLVAALRRARVDTQNWLGTFMDDTDGHPSLVAIDAALALAVTP